MLSGRIAVRREAGSQVFILLAICSVLVPLLGTLGAGSRLWRSIEMKNLMQIMHSGTRIVEHRGFCERAGGALILESVPAKGTSASLWLPAVPC